MSQTVVVTGATGFIAKHIVLKLLDRGHTVIASVRKPNRGEALRNTLKEHLGDPARLDALKTVVLDLTSDEGWQEAMAGADALIHTASPFPLAQPKDEDELIRPAVDGTLRALRAAKAAGITRVVLTSSAVAVMQKDRPDSGDRYTETDWSDLERPASSPYEKSKTLAERAAWDFVRDEAPQMQLTTINPVLVTGPPLDSDYGTSVQVVERVLKAQDPMLPRFSLPVVDVRDVAEAHVRALERPESAGKRFLAADETMWFSDIAKTVKAAFPERKVVTREAPNIFIRFLALFDDEIKAIVPELGTKREVSSAQAREVLGIEFIPAEQSVTDTAQWLVANGRV